MQRLMSVGLGYTYNRTYEPLQEVARKIAALTLEEVNALLEEKPFSRSFFYTLAPA